MDLKVTCIWFYSFDLKLNHKLHSILHITACHSVLFSPAKLKAHALSVTIKLCLTFANDTTTKQL